jgi:hypothetical protein
VVAGQAGELAVVAGQAGELAVVAGQAGELAVVGYRAEYAGDEKSLTIPKMGVGCEIWITGERNDDHEKRL